MGLDQYAYRMSKHATKGYFKFNEDDNSVEELCCWRKFWGLHEWMGVLAIKKGLDEDKKHFNSIPVRLTKADLKSLCDDVDYITSPDNCDSIWEWQEERKRLYNFIADATTAIDEGYRVYYVGDY